MITDAQWSAFVLHITERIAKEPEFSILRDSLSEMFGFQPPFFAEMNERARAANLQFVFNGAHWYSDGDPSEVLFFQLGRATRGTSVPPQMMR